MKTLRSFAPRLLAGVGMLALLAALGLFASHPAHTAGGPVPVTVSNTVQNRDVDSSARQPVETSAETILTQNSAGGFGSVLVYTVPAGKRLVVESVSLFAKYLNFDRAGYTVNVENVDSSNRSLSFTAFTAGPGTGATSAATQPMRLHVEPGNRVVVTVFDSHQIGDLVAFDVSLSGYLVDVP